MRPRTFRFLINIRDWGRVLYVPGVHAAALERRGWITRSNSGGGWSLTRNGLAALEREERRRDRQ